MAHSNRSGFALAILSAVPIGILAGFLQHTGFSAVTPAFLWVLLIYGILYLTALTHSTPQRGPALNLLLTAILGTIALALVLLENAVSPVRAGLLLFFFTLTLTASAWLVRHPGGGPEDKRCCGL